MISTAFSTGELAIKVFLFFHTTVNSFCFYRRRICTDFIVTEEKTYFCESVFGTHTIFMNIPTRLHSECVLRKLTEE